MVPPGPIGAKSQPPYSFGQPGQLFSDQTKVEASTISAAPTNQPWKVTNLGSQPKANPMSTFSMNPASTTTSSTIASTPNQDYSTVNLSDLHEFFPNISSAITQPDPAPSSQVNLPSSQTSKSFTLQGSQFRVEPPLVDEDIPEFHSFSDVSVPVNLESLNMDDLEDILNPRPDGGNGISMLGHPSCQSAGLSSSSAAAQTSAASQNISDPASNPGSTWMNYPNSIVHLLQSESMMDMRPNNNHQASMLDDYEDLMSGDEDRLLSIFNSGSQPGFVSGHPT